MRTVDFTPLYRSAVGFDRLAGLLESAARTSQENGWPPYNIETTGENAYRIEIAVAGFTPDELTLEVKENLLTVTGRKAANDEAAIDGRARTVVMAVVRARASRRIGGLHKGAGEPYGLCARGQAFVCCGDRLARP